MHNTPFSEFWINPFTVNYARVTFPRSLQTQVGCVQVQVHGDTCVVSLGYSGTAGDWPCHLMLSL